MATVNKSRGQCFETYSNQFRQILFILVNRTQNFFMSLISVMAGVKTTKKTTFKVIVVGESGVGKSHLTKRLVELDENIETKTTVGVDFLQRAVTVDGKEMLLNIWDTAGSERYRSIARTYYRDVDAVIVVYDITCQRSFVSLNFWLGEIQDNSAVDVPTFLVGNKLDLAERRVVPTKEGEELSVKNTMLFKEVSAKDRVRVNELFTDIVNELWDQARAKWISSNASTRDTIKLKSAPSKMYRFFAWCWSWRCW